RRAARAQATAGTARRDAVKFVAHGGSAEALPGVRRASPAQCCRQYRQHWPSGRPKETGTPRSGRCKLLGAVDANSSERSMHNASGQGIVRRRFRTPPCPRKGLRPPEPNVDNFDDSFLPERADTGRHGRLARPGKEIIMTARKAP